MMELKEQQIEKIEEIEKIEMPPLSKVYPCVSYCDGEMTELHDEIAVETAVSLVYNGIAHTVQMCSASDLKDFAIGFSITEGIVDKATDIYRVEVMPVCNGIEIHVELSNRHFEKLKRAKRNMSGRTGCGICGTESLQHVTRQLSRISEAHTLPYSAIKKAIRDFKSHQHLNQQTGSTHAAAYISNQGEILAMREDVGRHIALDKLIGHYLQSGYQGGAILVSSRASFEMVQKTVTANVSILLAMSGVTSMAAELSNQLNLTLAGYCREGKVSLYSQASRIHFN